MYTSYRLHCHQYGCISKHATLIEVRIGPFAMVHAFKLLYKCDGVSYNNALDAVTIFIVNTYEATRDEEMCKEIDNSFDLYETRTRGGLLYPLTL